jgi:hypothetical protein
MQRFRLLGYCYSSGGAVSGNGDGLLPLARIVGEEAYKVPSLNDANPSLHQSGLQVTEKIRKDWPGLA